MRLLRKTATLVLMLGVGTACGGTEDPAAVPADSIENVQERLEALEGVVEVETGPDSLDPDRGGVDTTVQVDRGISLDELTAVLEVFAEAEGLVGGELGDGGFTGTVHFADDGPVGSGSYLTTGSDHSAAEQAAAFLGAHERFPGAVVSITLTKLAIQGIDPEGRRVEAVALDAADDPAIAVWDHVLLEVTDSVEGAGAATLETEGQSLSDAAASWQSIVDVSSTVGGGASVESVSTLITDRLDDHVELRLLGTGDTEVPDFATWHPALATVIHQLADLAVDVSSDATLRMMVGRDSFLDVQVEPALIANANGDATWNQVVIDYLRGTDG